MQRDTDMKALMLSYQDAVESVLPSVIIQCAKDYWSGKVDGDDGEFRPAPPVFGKYARRKQSQMPASKALIEAPKQRPISAAYRAKMAPRVEALFMALGNKDATDALLAKHKANPISVPMYDSE
jgi:hypothetical protein